MEVLQLRIWDLSQTTEQSLCVLFQSSCLLPLGTGIQDSEIRNDANLRQIPEKHVRRFSTTSGRPGHCCFCTTIGSWLLRHSTTVQVQPLKHCLS